MKITVTIPDELLERLNARVAGGYLNRSQVLCGLVEQWLQPVNNFKPPENPDVCQPSASHPGDVPQTSASHPPDVCQPSASHPTRARVCAGSEREIDRSIDRSGFAQKVGKEEEAPLPAARPPKGGETKSMLPAEVQDLKAEYLHEGPETLEEVFDLIARANKRPRLALDHQKALLLAWRGKPMQRRLWAFRKLLQRRDQVPHPEEYLAQLIENGPKRKPRNGANRDQVSLFPTGPPGPGRDLVSLLAAGKRFGGDS